MLKINTKIIFLSIIFSTQLYSQIAKDSWSVGLGISYPRIMSLSSMSTGAWSGIGNYGGYVTLQRNFSEHVALRVVGRYNYMKTETSNNIQTNNLVATDFDMLYYFVPCEDLTPFLTTGFGGIFFTLNNSPQPQLDVTYTEYQFNLGFGAEWRFSEDWSLRAEGIYHTTSTNKIDGFDDPGEDKGLFGGNSDTYVTLNAGLQFYFSKGEPSTMCNLYEGVTVGAPYDFPTLDEIEELLKKCPCDSVVVVKEIIVEKPVEIGTQWVLVGVNFEFDSAQLTEGSFPILYGAVQYLNQHADIKVEIQGHCDYMGSENYNQKLSERRATTVRDYLISKGINSSRLTIKGYGESIPIADNNTPEGRALNRRIEFKVIE